VHDEDTFRTLGFVTAGGQTRPKRASRLFFANLIGGQVHGSIFAE